MAITVLFSGAHYVVVLLCIVYGTCVSTVLCVELVQMIKVCVREQNARVLGPVMLINVNLC